MKEAITLYTHPWSRGRVTRWMLEECGADYQVQVMEYGGSMKSKNYLAINSMGKVPALTHGDTVITENAAICMYLADVFTDKKLAPSVGSKERGLYYRWLMFAAGPIEAIATAKSLKYLPENQSNDEKSMAGYGCMDDIVKTLEQVLSKKDYLCGDFFSTADLYLTAGLNWYMQFGMMPKKPVFEAYVAKHISRPAAKKAFEMDEELSKQYPVNRG